MKRNWEKILAARAVIDATGSAWLAGQTACAADNDHEVNTVHWRTAEIIADMMPGTYRIVYGAGPGRQIVRCKQGSAAVIRPVTEADVRMALEVMGAPGVPMPAGDSLVALVRQALEEFSQRRTAASAPGRQPTKLERIEAAHWLRDARHCTAGFETTIENFDGLPEVTCEQAEQTIDQIIRTLERARSALRGHAVGALPGQRSEP